MFRVTHGKTGESQEVLCFSRHWPQELKKKSTFVYTTAECNAKQSTWIDDWKTVPVDKEYWTASGLLVKRIALSNTAAEIPNVAYWKRKLGNVNPRDAFSQLCVEDVQAFLNLPIEEQFKLLHVPKEYRPPFYKHRDAAVTFVQLMLDKRAQERAQWKRESIQRHALKDDAEGAITVEYCHYDDESQVRTLEEYKANPFLYTPADSTARNTRVYRG